MRTEPMAYMVSALFLILATVCWLAHTGSNMDGTLMASLVTGAISIASGIVGYAAPKQPDKKDVLKQGDSVMITSTKEPEK